MSKFKRQQKGKLTRFCTWAAACHLVAMASWSAASEQVSHLSREAANCDLVKALDCQGTLALEQDAEQPAELVLGVGLGSATGIPHYIGSDETRHYLLPIPYISYNGPRVKVGQGGITGKVFNSDKWFLSLSLSGAIPVNSKDNQARAGMDDLEAVVEYGPSLKYFFSGDDRSDDAVFFDFNVREARTWSLDSLDWTASPTLVYRQQLPQTWFGGVVKFTSQVRWEFVSDRYADYFYGVGRQEVTSTRPFYQASGGFAGYRINNSLRWQKDNKVFSLFVGYANISGASYAPSPLVKREQHVFAGSAFFWLFDWG